MPKELHISWVYDLIKAVISSQRKCVLHQSNQMVVLCNLISSEKRPTSIESNGSHTGPELPLEVKWLLFSNHICEPNGLRRAKFRPQFL